MSVNPPLAAMARRLSLRSRLAEEDRLAILDLPHTVRTLEPSTYIIREGDLPSQCSLLRSGFAYRQKTTGAGARQIVAIHVPGDILDLQNLFLEVSDHNLQILTRAEVVFIPRDALQRLARSRPAIEHAILIDALVEGSIVREWTLNVGRRDSKARLAHVLCEFSLRLESVGLGEREFELPMTQEQLADALGLTPVHVNRTIKSLEGQGLIRRENRRVLIPDWMALRDAGDFNERYLHLNQLDGSGGMAVAEAAPRLSVDGSAPT
jgi:CRP-like cAMP-binding protein